MILVTGPTGSGKSSTLYTALNWVKSPTKNIITVEDPIEYQLDGINQVQINTRAGVTFAAGLRSILRQDPNIILVGEIRDQETAGIALEAAQTGHLLLSTLHTNDAPGTISRLLDLGIEPFLIASAVIGILAQRLVRTPCPSCRELLPPSADAIEKAGGSSRLPQDGKWVAGRGCDACQQSGSKGRLAIHELLVVNDEIRELISRRESEHAIRKAARNAGMRTLLEDGIEKAAQGLTTLDDVVRVVAADDASGHKEQATKPQSSDATVVEQTAGATKIEVEVQKVGARPGGRLDPAAEAGEAEAFPMEPGQAEEVDASSRKKTVLVVEDSPTIASVVKYFLELEGFHVLIAKDGAQGLETARKHSPDVVVTDYDMPGMDGASMVKALRDDIRSTFRKPRTC
jgi:CheY-like chemotaxis protein